MKTGLTMLAVVLCTAPLLAGCKGAARAFATGAMGQKYEPVYRAPTATEQRIQQLEQEIQELDRQIRENRR